MSQPAPVLPVTILPVSHTAGLAEASFNSNLFHSSCDVAIVTWSIECYKITVCFIGKTEKQVGNAMWAGIPLSVQQKSCGRLVAEKWRNHWFCGCRRDLFYGSEIFHWMYLF